MSFNKRDKNLFLGSSGKLFSNAREQRKYMTKSEAILWQQLRNNKLMGWKFRRQHPVAGFIADFYCHEARLVIELDGEIHNLPEHREHDNGRTHTLGENGIRVLRFRNKEVFDNIESVIDRIATFLSASPPVLPNSPPDLPASPPAPSTSPPTPLLKERGEVP